MLDLRSSTALLLTLGLVCGAQACSSSGAPGPGPSSSVTSSSGTGWGAGGDGTSGSGGEGGDGTSSTGGAAGGLSTGAGVLPAECEIPSAAGGATADSGFSLQWTADLGLAPNPVGPGSLTIDADGNILVLGTFSDALDLGSGVTLSLPGKFGGYLAKLSPTGQALWARMAPLLGARVYTDATSSIWVSDVTDHSTVTRYDAAGTPLWSKTFTGAGPLRILPTADGGALLVDDFYAPLDYGSGSLDTSPSFYRDLFVIKVDALGAVLWVKALGAQMWPAPAPGDERGITLHDVAPAPGGGLVFLARTSLQGAIPDLRLVRVDSSGDLLWTRTFQPLGNNDHPVLAADAAGNSLIALIVTEFSSHDAFGCGTLPYGLALAMTDDGGKPRWTRYFQIPAAQIHPSFDPGGNLLLAGLFGDPIDLGGGALPPRDPTIARIAVAKLSPLGEPLASRAFSTNLTLADSAFILDATTRPDGDLLVMLSHVGALDLGGVPLPTTSARSGALTRLTP